jgi:sulfur carrier protein
MRLFYLYVLPPSPIFMTSRRTSVNATSPFGGARLELSRRILLNWRGRLLPLRKPWERSLATHLENGREIIVNGDKLATCAATLDELVTELGFAGKRIATARNGNFVAERARTMTAIERGDRIEIVSPRHGG